MLSPGAVWEAVQTRRKEQVGWMGVSVPTRINLQCFCCCKSTKSKAVLSPEVLYEKQKLFLATGSGQLRREERYELDHHHFPLRFSHSGTQIQTQYAVFLLIILQLSLLAK